MNIREYRLYGASELAAVTHAVGEALAHWREEWLASHSQLGEPSVCREPFRNGGEGPRWLTGQVTGGGSLSIGYPAGLATLFAELVTGRSLDERPVAGKASPLESALQTEMLHSLGEEILKRTGVSVDTAVDWSDRGVPAQASDEHSGFLTLRVKLGPATAIDFVLSPEIAAGVLGDAAVAPSSVTVEPRQAALGSESLRLNVTLQDAELRLDELNSLAVGHVIALPHQLDMPARATLGDGEVLCAGHLGVCRGKKAIQLLPIE